MFSIRRDIWNKSADTNWIKFSLSGCKTATQICWQQERLRKLVAANHLAGRSLIYEMGDALKFQNIILNKPKYTAVCRLSQNILY